MKFIFVILALLLTVKECDQKKQTINETKSEIVNSENVAKLQQADYIIEYTAMSRGFYKEVRVSNSSIEVKNSRASESISKDCSQELWSNIMKNLQNVDVQNISKLKAPSEMRFVDGAAFAKLKIIDKDAIYISPEFDHGFPPKEIKALCDKILEISNNKKQ